jgi:hypothetical protein
VVTRHPIYAVLIRLYPSEFRHRYGDDLVQHFADLKGHRSARHAMGRTAIDLLVTVPRYRLESIMSANRSGTAIFAAVVLLATGGLAAILIGIPYYIAVSLLFVALVLTIAQRGTLARAIARPGSSRSRRLILAGVLATVFAGATGGYLWDLGDEAVSSLGLLGYTAVGTFALVGAVASLAAAVFTPGASRRRAATEAR